MTRVTRPPPRGLSSPDSLARPSTSQPARPRTDCRPPRSTRPLAPPTRAGASAAQASPQERVRRRETTRLEGGMSLHQYGCPPPHPGAPPDPLLLRMLL